MISFNAAKLKKNLNSFASHWWIHTMFVCVYAPFLIPMGFMMNLFTRDDKLPLECYFYQFALRACVCLYSFFLISPLLPILFGFPPLPTHGTFFRIHFEPLAFHLRGFSRNKLLYSNTSEKILRTIYNIHAYVDANQVHLNIYLSRTVDAMRIWLIGDRNLSHNFKLRMVEHNTNGNLWIFASDCVHRMPSFPLPRFFAWLNRVHGISTNFRTHLFCNFTMFEYKNTINFE